MGGGKHFDVAFARRLRGGCGWATSMSARPDEALSTDGPPLLRAVMFLCCCCELAAHVGPLALLDFLFVPIAALVDDERRR
jgi:hypothetical protein